MPASGRAAAETRPDWPGYYAATADRPPRRTTLTALAARHSGRGPAFALAVDLGCGGGRDTAPLLEAGLTVLALDRAPEAGPALQARFPAAWSRGQLTFRRADLSAADLDLPPSGLVNASFCLPLCPPDRFDGLWVADCAGGRPGRAVRRPSLRSERQLGAARRRPDDPYPRAMSTLGSPAGTCC